MRRKVFLLSAGAAVVALVLFALGSQTPAAQADESTTSWDVAIYDEETDNEHCTNDGLAANNAGECVDVETNVWIQTSNNDASTEEYFDLVNSRWLVDGAVTNTTEDLDGDTDVDDDVGYVIPANGLRATPGDIINLGATVGQITFQICGNVVPANVTFGNNIDDYATNGDDTVRGQPATCNNDTGNPNVSPPFNATFPLWNATMNTGATDLVDILDDACDGDGDPQTQADFFSEGDDCTNPCNGGAPNPDGAPDGVSCTPSGLMPTLNASGYLPYMESRSYGIAELEISAAVSTYADVNFIIFNMLSVPEVQGYQQLVVVLYPDQPTEDPSDPGYKVTGQTVWTCAPYYSAPTHIFGVTTDSDFNGDGDTVDLGESGIGGEINRQIVGDTGTFDYLLQKSVIEDFDGDTVPAHLDRCDTDPTAGGAADDLDGDTLTGDCDDFEDPDCPTDQTQGCDGNVLAGTWNGAPPWDAGQDADGDWTVNYNDNCPNTANSKDDPNPQLDTDRDGVGDACDPSPYIPGDGTGYAGSPGNYLDHDNICIDQYTLGAAEPLSEAGAIPGKYCYVDEASYATTQPYVNPPMATLDIEYNDSNDDGDPDWADLDGDSVYDIGEPIDTDDNTDNPTQDPTTDYESDACEAVLNTDPLDPSENNGSGSDTLMDCDGDTVSDADEEAAGTNPFPFTKVIVSLGFEAEDQTGHEGTVDDGALRWAQVNDIPSVCSDEPVPEDPPGLPGDPPPPSAIVVTNTENFTLITDDLDCSSEPVDILKTVTLTTDDNCEIGDFLDEPKPQADDEAVQGPLAESEPKGWSTQETPLEWDVHMLGEEPCILTLTVVKDPTGGEFDPQTEVQTIEVRLPTGCVFDNDADCDACWDDSEPGLTPAATPDCPWDFYDVPVPTLGAGGHISGDPSGTDDRDHAISIIADVLAVLEYSGTSDEGPANANGRDYDDDVNGDGVDDGIAYDRFTAPGGSCPARSSDPDGAISIIIDVLLVLDQSGDSC